MKKVKKVEIKKAKTKKEYKSKMVKLLNQFLKTLYSFDDNVDTVSRGSFHTYDNTILMRDAILKMAVSTRYVLEDFKHDKWNQ